MIFFGWLPRRIPEPCFETRVREQRWAVTGG
ncbi:hypothetical protein BJ970_006709 [Saccharopolyspora phatthalungensis]|uniref:Uncharacterized protein n=1 Tax=Saccharopolyspora phatthalungensis TaxID=664693 RepID=A0A840QGM0_9PSEU|nr:hypothetical protein [Saccharopolyspora phatthalungensis]